MSAASSTPPDEGLTIRRFSTDGIAPRERHEMWRSQGWPSVGQLCESRAEPDFAADATTVSLPPATLIVGRYGGQQIHRTATLIRRNPVDHLHVTIPLEGAVEAESGIVVPGSAIICDLACEWRHRAQAGTMAIATIPRGVALAHGIDPRAVHGTVIAPAAATLVREHVRLVVDNAAAIPRAAADRLAGTIVDLLSVSLAMQNGAVRPDALAVDGAVKHRARRLIAASLERDGLHANAIARELGVSRSHLYRLFEEEGGIQRYIREERLNAVKMALVRSDGRIGEIAARFRFSEPAHFSRVFRARFGMTPSEWRALCASVRRTG